jgi:hypothetical protein
VRISDADGNKLDYVYLALSDDEASELSDKLVQLQSETGSRHAHVSDADFQMERTIYREDDATVLS